MHNSKDKCSLEYYEPYFRGVLYRHGSYYYNEQWNLCVVIGFSVYPFCNKITLWRDIYGSNENWKSIGIHRMKFPCYKLILI